MAWKNLKQRSLAEAMLIDHDALKELDAVHELIDWTLTSKNSQNQPTMTINRQRQVTMNLQTIRMIMPSKRHHPIVQTLKPSNRC